MVAADGRCGVEEFAGIPPGDTLAEIRKKESICASKILGIQPPIFYGFGMVDGMCEYFDQTIALKGKLKKVLEEIKPDVLITFGPDGDTGHPDHRGISDITTVVILREGWAEKYPLYFIGWLKEKIVNIPQGGMTSLNYSDKKNLNVHIKYTEEDRKKLFGSLSCYKSQFTDRDVKNWIDAELKDSSFIFYFRRFMIETDEQKDFLGIR